MSRERRHPPAHGQDRRRFPQDAHEDVSRKQIPLPDPTFVRIVQIIQRLSKYADDVFAVILLAVAAISLLGLTGLSSGALVEAWVQALQAWFGWGAALVPLTLGIIGALIVAHNLGRLPPIKWGRVIAAEVGVFALLGLLNLANGGQVALAVEGRGGGLVGWGLGYLLARIFPPPADAFVLGSLLLLCLFFALPATAERLNRLLRWIQSQGFEAQSGAQRPRPLPERDARRAAEGRALAEKLRSPAPERPKTRLAAGERLRVPVETVADEIKLKKKRDRRLPGLDLLDDSDLRKPAQKEIDETASIIVKTLKEFGVPVTVLGARVGPSVTQYQVEPGFVEKAGPDGLKLWKVRVAQIASLQNDLALALSATSLRIEAPVPGQRYVGIEVPHRRTSLVGVRPVIESEAFQRINKPLALAFGRDVSGAAIAADLGSMPHLLIAGTTGAGKSVCIVSLITCLVVNNTPDDLRLVLIDPKMVELVRFNGLPHLYGKVETELTRILGVMRWTTREMDRRYKLFEAAGARNLDTYNAKLARKKDAEHLPRIVLVVDELADLMMQAPDETERMVVRLAQMARATGIHLVVATQRPSVDVVTGLIKANFPARAAFAVASGIDSRVILDQPGAESLLGRGDMLLLLPEIGIPLRLQGCFVTDKEVDRLVSWWREQAEAYEDEPVPLNDPQAEAETTAAAESAEKPGLAPWDEMLAREQVIEDKDRQIEQAIEIVKRYGNASASLLQRKMRIGYPRAARLMDELKAMGIVGREQAGGKTREVFVGKDDDPIGQRAARILGGEGDEEE
jgi:S-DNA-T family DNA segregation ATPase FtsK/SpoIIIE